MKMNIHIWFNKCQLLIYMSVGKRRQRGANSAGRNWAPNSQLAWSSRPVHGGNWPLKAGIGPPAGKTLHTPGASAPRPSPLGEGSRQSPSRNPTGILGTVTFRWTPESHLNHRDCSPMGLSAQRGLAQSVTRAPAPGNI